MNIEEQLAESKRREAELRKDNEELSDIVFRCKATESRIAQLEQGRAELQDVVKRALHALHVSLAAIQAAARAEEREACALIADEYGRKNSQTGVWVARDIRNRGNGEESK